MSSTTLLPKTVRHERWRAIAVVAFAGHTAWIASAPIAFGSNAPITRLGSAVAVGIIGSMAVIPCVWQAVRGPRMLRVTWAAFAVTAALAGLTPIVDLANFGAHHVLSEEGVIGSLAMIAGLGYRIAFVAGLVALISFPTAVAARARVFVDSAIICTVLMFALWLGLRSHVGLVSDLSMWQQSLILAPFLLDLFIATLSAMLLYIPRQRGRLASRLTGYFAAASLANIAADIVAAGNASTTKWSLISSLLLSAVPLILAVSATWPRPIVRATRMPAALVAGGQMLTGGAATLVLLMILAEVRFAGRIDLVSEWVASCLLVFVLIRQSVLWLEGRWLTSVLEEEVIFQAEALGRREHLFQALVQHSSDVIAIVRRDGGFEYTSPSMESQLGYPKSWLESATIHDLIAPDDQARATGLLGMSIEAPDDPHIARWTLLRVNGEPRLFEVNVRNLLDDFVVNGLVINLRDVTERKQLESRLMHQSLHDDLTGMPNRAYLRLQIERCLSQWVLQRDPFSLVVIDVDDFKSINDTLGHVAGDTVLRIVSERIAACTRRNDMVVRLAADEFGVLLSGVTADDNEARAVVERIIESVKVPFVVDGRNISVGVSIGFACVEDLVQHADDIVRNAELALHVAKSRARGTAVFFERDMHEAALRRIDMEADLRRAIEQDELQLFYQPTVDLETGHLNGFEALLRWPHPERGYISPVDFIPIAEESGLILPLGKWVLRQACHQLARWQARYPNGKQLHMNVNLSARQLDQPHIVEEIDEVIRESGVSPFSIVLEMTESVLSNNEATTKAKLERIEAMGCTLAIDDFGTGYSSLSYLRQYPMRVLKIDRSFIVDICEPGKTDHVAMIKTILELARTLEVKTVAEGIETMDQLLKLRSLGCDIGQGFFMARPASAEDIRRLVEATFARGIPLVTYAGVTKGAPR